MTKEQDTAKSGMKSELEAIQLYEKLIASIKEEALKEPKMMKQLKG
jgi:rubrerythrin